MEHLTSEEILNYAKMNEFNEENRKLSAKVTKHIMHCEECLARVRKALASWEAFQAICTRDDAGIRGSVFDISKEELAAEAKALETEEGDESRASNR